MVAKSGEATLRQASTVLILRPAATGFEVFMLQRNRNTGFMPNAWVFPGGRVDEEDAQSGLPTVGGSAAIQAMGIPADQAKAFLVAAVRETFEESGLWLGQGTLTETIRDQMMGGLPFLSALQQGDGRIDLDCLDPWAWWVTPKIESRRYDTRFFLTVVGADAQGQHDERESANSCWIDPAVALQQANRGELPMAPPTWWSLTELAGMGTIQAVQEAVPGRIHRPIQPILSANEAGEWTLKLPGHPDHSDPSIPGLPAAVRFDQGRWWAEVAK
jgi:8-oxo-dGTP pyrophosphatase MutT (NUDIX family)